MLLVLVGRRHLHLLRVLVPTRLVLVESDHREFLLYQVGHRGWVSVRNALRRLQVLRLGDGLYFAQQLVLLVNLVEELLRLIQVGQVLLLGRGRLLLGASRTVQVLELVAQFRYEGTCAGLLLSRVTLNCYVMPLSDFLTLLLLRGASRCSGWVLNLQHCLRIAKMFQLHCLLGGLLLFRQRRDVFLLLKARLLRQVQGLRLVEVSCVGLSLIGAARALVERRIND